MDCFVRQDCGTSLSAEIKEQKAPGHGRGQKDFERGVADAEDTMAEDHEPGSGIGGEKAG